MVTAGVEPLDSRLANSYTYSSSMAAESIAGGFDAGSCGIVAGCRGMIGALSLTRDLSRIPRGRQKGFARIDLFWAIPRPPIRCAARATR